MADLDVFEGLGGAIGHQNLELNKRLLSALSEITCDSIPERLLIENVQQRIMWVSKGVPG